MNKRFSLVIGFFLPLILLTFDAFFLGVNEIIFLLLAIMIYLFFRKKLDGRSYWIGSLVATTIFSIIVLLIDILAGTFYPNIFYGLGEALILILINVVAFFYFGRIKKETLADAPSIGPSS